MDVKIEKPAIYQFYDEAQGIIHIVDSVIKTFLNSFGVEEENGLSNFYREFASKEELKN